MWQMMETKHYDDTFKNIRNLSSTKYWILIYCIYLFLYISITKILNSWPKSLGPRVLTKPKSKFLENGLDFNFFFLEWFTPGPIFLVWNNGSGRGWLWHYRHIKQTNDKKWDKYTVIDYFSIYHFYFSTVKVISNTQNFLKIWPFLGKCIFVYTFYYFENQYIPIWAKSIQTSHLDVFIFA